MRTTKRVTLYDVLGVPRDIKDESLKSHYRMLCRALHPDTKPESERASATRIFAEISAAYEVLGDPDKRKIYDEALDGELTEEDLQTIVTTLGAAGEAFRTGGLKQRLGAVKSLFTDPTIAKIGQRLGQTLERLFPGK